MRDFPIFTTENGVASLTLKEIPYTKSAYIKIQASAEPEKLLEECLDFCTVAGAEHIYGSDHPIFEKYPFHTSILKMQIPRESLDDTDAALFPVLEETVESWRKIYNERMTEVPNFSYMSASDAKKILECGTGYFVHRGDALLGIGIAGGDKIDAIASVVKGAGRDVVLALNHALSGEQAALEVASTNLKAMRLYDQMGFLISGEISRWFCLK